MRATPRFAGKVVVVTGPAQGIGRSVALRLAEEGASLALVDRSPMVEEVRHEAEAAGAQAIAVTADLETFDGADAAMQRALATFGRIDVLINNVGGTIWARPYADYQPDQIEAEVRRSLFPTLWCCRAVLPTMQERGAGVIVNVSSVATRGVNRVPYAAAKGGVNAITACLAMEYAQHGIRVCANRAGRDGRAATAHPAQRRGPVRAGDCLVSAGGGPDGLLQPDEAIRHDGGAGGRDPVPGFRRRLLHHRRHPAGGGRRSRLNQRCQPRIHASRSNGGRTHEQLPAQHERGQDAARQGQPDSTTTRAMRE